MPRPRKGRNMHTIKAGVLGNMNKILEMGYRRKYAGDVSLAGTIEAVKGTATINFP